MARKVAGAIPMDAIEELVSEYELMVEELEDKIDRLDGLEVESKHGISEFLQKRLDGYNKKKDALEQVIHNLSDIKDEFEYLLGSIDTLEATIN